MTTLKFADTHNMVAFLSKPAESEGFKHIVDFLNAHTIKYALTVNPTIYTSCIEQFWATIKAKTVNREVQLQALVDGKKIIITESIVRRDLQLEDTKGVNCLPNATIFEQLTLMGYEKNSQKLTFYKAFFSQQWKFLIHTILQCLSAKNTAWNEFSSTMTSAIICLATNQKFNFSKYIFESMVKNLDNVSGKFLIYPRSRRTKRKDTQLPQPSVPTTNVADEAVNEEMDDSLVRAATTASSLEVEHDSGNIDKTQSKETPNEPSYPGTSSGGGPRRQETIRDTIAQTRSENVSKLSNDPLLVGSSRRVESSRDEEGLGEDASKQGRRIHDIDVDEDITLVNNDNEMFDVGTLTGDEVLAVQVVAAKDVNLCVDEVTLAQALATLKSEKVQEIGDVIKESSVPVSASTKDSAAATTATIPTSRKGIVFQEPAEFDKEVRLAREKAEKEQEANVALTEEWDDIQAKIEADHELAQRLQAQEQEEFSDTEKDTLFLQLLEKRRKHFAAKRVEEKRNKPPTQAQQRKIILGGRKFQEGRRRVRIRECKEAEGG
ncbi:hypothetical protein Tco_0006374 [Tanacetum coccineum]